MSMQPSSNWISRPTQTGVGRLRSRGGSGWFYAAASCCTIRACGGGGSSGRCAMRDQPDGASKSPSRLGSRSQ
eukprot:1534928-Rhodomonas_salina.1